MLASGIRCLTYYLKMTIRETLTPQQPESWILSGMKCNNVALVVALIYY